MMSNMSDDAMGARKERSITNDEAMNWFVNEYIDKITKWHYDRNLIDGTTDQAQMTKLNEEYWELDQSITKGESPIDDIGDMIVVLINIAERNNLTIEQCLEHAYNDIKDRTGKMVDGVFVKDSK